MLFKGPVRYGLCFILVVGSICQVVKSSDEPDEVLDEDMEDFKAQSLVEFENMISCATLRSALYYVSYGCYCGLGGSGTPLDATDRCCKAHDECYSRAIQNSGCGILELFYLVYKRDGCTGCKSLSSYGSDPKARCKYALCQCDGTAARCFARNKATYNNWYYLYPRWRCWLG
ncbi:acidic phospholipase A2-like isoform X1 [Ptychodera flava]|uniref:acidic phospholipase A2-like isoform X1 n=1 Tax=Ptychodera flava TaxID=63121 RepID=UPI00396A58BC